LLLAAPDPSPMKILRSLITSDSLGVYCFTLGRTPRVNPGKTVSSCSKFLGKLNSYALMYCCRDSTGQVPDEAQSKAFPDDFWDHFVCGDWLKIDWMNEFVGFIESVKNDCEPAVVPPDRIFQDRGEMCDFRDYFGKLLEAFDILNTGPYSFQHNFDRVLTILKKTNTLPEELRLANLNRVRMFAAGIILQGSLNWKAETMNIRNHSMPRVKAFLAPRDRIILDLESFEQYKDKWKALRVNFTNYDPTTGGDYLLPSCDYGCGW
jgi:hypothetical protein